MLQIFSLFMGIRIPRPRRVRISEGPISSQEGTSLMLMNVRAKTLTSASSSIPDFETELNGVVASGKKISL
jgi:hypothetical protein